ncbi:TadE/TadG family type IV pilus assembly protein [Streptomyces parvus]|uniref:TadE/TadG family type IV pilus assembly protein n=1 Tax=Streptomyces parvus TaxID=66428 RepID=UPI0033FCE6B4
MHRPKRLRARLRADDGGVVVFVAICTVALLGLIGIILEGGGKMRAAERADAVAMEAARAGGQALDPAGAVTGTGVRADPAAATAAAYAYLSSAGVSGRVSASADGRKLTVTVNDTYVTKILPVVGIGSMAVTGHGTATLLHGVTQPE